MSQTARSPDPAVKLSPILGRVAVGTLLAVGVFCVVMFTPTGVLALLVTAWTILATLEFLRLLERADIRLNPWLLSILNASIALAAWLGWLPGYLLVPVGVVFVATVLTSSEKPRVPVYGIFVLIYVGLLPAHLVMLKRLAVAKQLSMWLVLFPLLATWLCDTAAWGVGKLIGRRQLMPRISPGKTVEGFVAGLVAPAILAPLLLKQLAPFNTHVWPIPVVIGILLGILAQLGDLFESIFKRAVDAKDSSGALGEHGGFLDRVDSLLFTIPAWYYLLAFYLR